MESSVSPGSLQGWIYHRPRVSVGRRGFIALGWLSVSFLYPVGNTNWVPVQHKCILVSFSAVELYHFSDHSKFDRLGKGLCTWPPLFKSSYYSAYFTFAKRPTCVPAFENRKESAEDFRFYQKRQRVKIVVTVCFAAAVTETARAQADRVALLFLYVSVILGFICYLV